MSDEIHYRLPWRAHSVRPGHHRGRDREGGFVFARHAPLLDAPDPRRIDVRASARDPLERILVRVYSQNAALTVHVLVDVSASMGGAGRHRKLDVAADLVAALAYSAYRTGDRFGVMACDSGLRDGLGCPPGHGAGTALARRLRSHEPAGRGSQGLVEAAARIRTRGALVFVASDFFFPPWVLEAVLDGLSGHSVVPVVIADAPDAIAPAGRGLVYLADSESAGRRTLLMRAALRRRVRARYCEWRDELERRCQACDVAPLWLEGGFSADRVTRYFFP